jgi:hypothetical protein
MGFFFRVPTGWTLPAGSLIGVYHCRDTTLLKLKAPPMPRNYSAAVSTGPGGYVVAARPFKKQKQICGPGCSNDNFDIFNCYIAYNSTYKRSCRLP